jgi:hypothetical protein
MLTTDKLRALLTAGLGREARVNAYIDELINRRHLPEDETATSLPPRSIVIALLAFLKRARLRALHLTVPRRAGLVVGSARSFS